jgi:hypothetical protein|tara:strand:+ start:1001 stop:1234 length:234 start_codon:yes stop_codon:yes gene_type:complete
MNAKQIVYLAHQISEGELIYDKDAAIIGYFTGFSTSPTAKSRGSIQYEVVNGDTGWISGNAVYIKGFGVKFTEDYVG